MKRTAILLAFGISAAAAAAATTVILNDGTVVETDDNVYISTDPLYSLTEAEPVDTTVVEPEPPTDPDEVDCNDPRPTFDGTFESVWAGKAWDAACGG